MLRMGRLSCCSHPVHSSSSSRMAAGLFQFEASKVGSQGLPLCMAA